jgi:uncharacterized protein
MPSTLTSRTVFSFAITIASAISVLPVSAASFPCEKATAPIEKAICNSDEVSQLDEYLGRYYAAARYELKHAESCMIGNQREWLQTVRDECRNAPCLKRAYLNRLAVLHTLQPGATSLRNVQLPKLPTLVWIVPAAADQLAAPRNLQTFPFVASGKIVNEIAGGDGFVLHSPAGTKHVIVPLMFLEQPTVDALAGLSRLPNASFEVRGHIELDAGQAKAFASSRCTFVYRTAP